MTQQNDASAEDEFLFYLNEDNNSTHYTTNINDLS